MLFHCQTSLKRNIGFVKWKRYFLKLQFPSLPFLPLLAHLLKKKRNDGREKKKKKVYTFFMKSSPKKKFLVLFILDQFGNSRFQIVISKIVKMVGGTRTRTEPRPAEKKKKKNLDVLFFCGENTPDIKFLNPRRWFFIFHRDEDKDEDFRAVSSCSGENAAEVRESASKRSFKRNLCPSLQTWSRKVGGQGRRQMHPKAHPGAEKVSRSKNEWKADRLQLCEQGRVGNVINVR